MFGKFRAPNCLSAEMCNAAENASGHGPNLDLGQRFDLRLGVKPAEQATQYVHSVRTKRRPIRGLDAPSAAVAGLPPLSGIRRRLG